MTIDPVDIIEQELHEDDCDVAEGCRCEPLGAEYRRKRAERILSALRGAGVAVAELPESTDEVHNLTTGRWRATFGPVRARFLHITDDQDHSLSEIDCSVEPFSVKWHEPEEVYAAAAGLLAGLAWIEQLKVSATAQDAED